MSLILPDLPPIQIAATAGIVRPGLEVELGNAGPRAGAMAWLPMFGSAPAQTLWAGYDWRIGQADQLGLVVGATHYVQSVGCLDACAPAAEYGAFVGATYLLREERLWLRVTPHWYVPLGGPSAYPTLALSNVPWAELGFALTPNCDVSVRVAETQLKIGYRL